MNNASGINEAKIDELALKLYDLIEQIQIKLNKVDELTNDSKQFAKGEFADNYYKKYNDLSMNFPILISNLTTYVTDIVALKYRFQNADDELKKVMNQNEITEINSNINRKSEDLL